MTRATQFFYLITKLKQENSNLIQPNGKAVHIHQIVGCLPFVSIKTIPIVVYLVLEYLRRFL